MKKRAQEYSSFYNPAVASRTFGDLVTAIRADQSMDIAQRAQLIGQIKGITGYANESTPLSALMLKGLGGIIGWLISKYFGMSPVGQLVSTLAGYGMGKAINNQLNKPKPPVPGLESVVMEAPPNYKDATDPARSCATCKYFYKLSNNCRRYNVKVAGHMTCRTWKKAMAKLAAIRIIGFLDKCAAMGADTSQYTSGVPDYLQTPEQPQIPPTQAAAEPTLADPGASNVMTPAATATAGQTLQESLARSDKAQNAGVDYMGLMQQLFQGMGQGQNQQVPATPQSGPVKAAADPPNQDYSAIYSSMLRRGEARKPSQIAQQMPPATKRLLAGMYAAHLKRQPKSTGGKFIAKETVKIPFRVAGKGLLAAGRGIGTGYNKVRDFLNNAFRVRR